MIDAKRWTDVRLGSRVRRTQDGAVLRVSAKYQDRDGSVRFQCRTEGADSVMVSGSDVDLID